MPGPSRQPATSGHHVARTSRGNFGGTRDSTTAHGAALRRARAHRRVRGNHVPSATADASAADSADAVEAPHDGGPETAIVGPIRLAVTVAARAILFAILGIVARAMLPFALGWQPTTVMTGSMEPRISAGDVVIHAAFSAAAPTQDSSFAALSSYPCLSPTVQDNPSFFYSFNEGSGPVAGDASAFGRNGTLLGDAARVPGSCAPGDSPALDLGPTAGAVSTAQIVRAPDTFSVAIWFKTMPGTTPGGRLLGFGNAQAGASTLSDRHLYLTDSGGIGFGAATRNDNSEQFKAAGITSPSTYNDGKWHLATATMTRPGRSCTWTVCR